MPTPIRLRQIPTITITICLSLLFGFTLWWKRQTLIPYPPEERLQPGDLPMLLANHHDLTIRNQLAYPYRHASYHGIILTCQAYWKWQYLPWIDSFWWSPFPMQYYTHIDAFKQVGRYFPELNAFQWCRCHVQWTTSQPQIHCPKARLREPKPFRKTLQNHQTYAHWFRSNQLLPLDSLFHLEALLPTPFELNLPWDQHAYPELMFWQEHNQPRGFFVLLARNRCAYSDTCFPDAKPSILYHWEIVQDVLNIHPEQRLLIPERGWLTALAPITNQLFCYTRWIAGDTLYYRTYCRQLEQYKVVARTFPRFLLERPIYTTSTRAFCIDTAGFTLPCFTGSAPPLTNPYNLLPPQYFRLFTIPNLPFWHYTWLYSEHLWIHPFFATLHIAQTQYQLYKSLDPSFLSIPALPTALLKTCLKGSSTQQQQPSHAPQGFFSTCTPLFLQQPLITDRIIPIITHNHHHYLLIGYYLPHADSTFKEPWRYRYRLIHINTQTQTIQHIADYALNPLSVQWWQLRGTNTKTFSTLTTLSTLHFEFIWNHKLYQVIFVPNTLRLNILDDYSFVRTLTHRHKTHRLFLAIYQIRLPS